MATISLFPYLISLLACCAFLPPLLVNATDLKGHIVALSLYEP